jgi:hypothetical protein
MPELMVEPRRSLIAAALAVARFRRSWEAMQTAVVEPQALCPQNRQPSMTAGTFVTSMLDRLDRGSLRLATVCGQAGVPSAQMMAATRGPCLRLPVCLS